VPIFLVLAVVAIIIWLRVLRLSDSLANRLRENLITTLAKTE
jgi:hypothetical protein